MEVDTVIQNGTIVTASEMVQADLGIKDGKIAVIGRGLQGIRSIDAQGLYVIPGAIDPHVHLDMFDGKTTSSDDWDSGTLAAAYGGTTTIIDFVEPTRDQTLLEGLAERRSRADGRVFTDYALHMTFDRADEKTLAEIPDVVAAGVTSFKMYTTYPIRVSDEDMLAGLKVMGLFGALPIVHCENNAIVEYMRSQLLLKARNAPSSHPLSRPAAAEGEAVERVLSMAEVAQVPVYIVHVSTGRAAKAIRRARQRGVKAYGETCPQYLLLNDRVFEQPGFEGAKYVCSPPLRKESDNAILWKALASDTLQTIGTDHCPFYYHGQKDLGKDNFTQIPGGIPGIESRVSLIYSYGVAAGKLSLGKWIDACSTMPAKLFGLYPRKGSLMPGADADIVLFDPNRKITLTKSVLHENVDYTPYEGMTLHGFPVLTMIKGQVIIENNLAVGNARGEFLACGLPQL